MPVSLYDTLTMLGAYKQIQPARTFLRDRYFPSTSADIFYTPKVLAEYGTEKRRMAPVVMRRVAGVTIDREGYELHEFEPPTIAPKRVLTVDTLEQKQFGEAIFGDRTPEERAAAILRQDLQQMDQMIATTEEHMAAQILQNNSCVMEEYANDAGMKSEKGYELYFYRNNNNPAKYIPAKSWADPDANKMDDLYEMHSILAENGHNATDLLITPKVAKLIIADKELRELLDNRRMEIGHIAPKMLPNGTRWMGVINIMGAMLDIYILSDTYVNFNGDMVPFIKDGTIILTFPGCGCTKYGAVTQLGNDERHHTHPGKRVPKVIVDHNMDSRDLIVKSRPLLLPKSELPWIAAEVV